MLRTHRAGWILLVAMALSCLCVTAPCGAEPPSFLRLFGRKKVEADPSKHYALTEVEGPWLIYAHTFTGPSAREKAQQLVLELRSEYNLKAFSYHEDFDFTQPLDRNDPVGRKLKYASQTRFDAYAVLVGEFDSVDHPEVAKTLETIKTITPSVFQKAKPEDEVGVMATIRRIRDQVLVASQDSEVKRGKMYHAFVTRNPLLPEDFTQPPEVDSFVRKLNENVEHSLIDCPGRFTVVVRTFEGLSTTMIAGKVKDEIDGTDAKARMDRNMLMANKMCEALREEGVEAYEFHDRTKSMVTIGSFDSLGSNGPRGFQYSPEINAIMRKYAGTERVGRDPQGNMVRYVNNIAKIPYDVQPRPIAVPKADKRSFYSAAFGRD